MSRSVIRGFRPDLFEAARVDGAKISRSDLARLAGLKTAETIRRWENGSASPQIDLLKRALAALRIDAVDVIRTDPRERYLSDWRHLRLMTQPQLAQQAGIATHLVMRIERGERELTDTIAAGLATALQITELEVRAAYERARTRPAGSPA